MRIFLAALLLASSVSARAQTSPWQIEPSETTADLRGVHAVGGGVVWASGTGGTVLRSQDSGFEWQQCAIPAGAEKLDFRAVWAWDDQAAIVMSSGPGELSRLYKTTDGCAHWTLLYTNPDKDGFWDALQFTDQDHGTLLGDPVGGAFTVLRTADGGKHWSRVSSPSSPGLHADPSTAGAFAASNSSLIFAAQVLNSTDDGNFIYWFVTGGTARSFVFHGQSLCSPKAYHQDPETCSLKWAVTSTRLPLATGTGGGAFSLSVLDGDERIHHAVVVGGDYGKPAERAGTAAYWDETEKRWTAATQPPGGYRSAVEIEPDSATVENHDHARWIAVGPNGSDISSDGGKTWEPLEHAPAGTPKAGEWNALSLPWVVGPHGRIAKFNPGALEQAPGSGQLSVPR